MAAARVKSEKPDRFFQTIDKISVIGVSDIWGKFRMCRYRIFSTTVSALTRRRLTILNLNIELRGMRKNPFGVCKLQICALHITNLIEIVTTNSIQSSLEMGNVTDPLKWIQEQVGILKVLLAIHSSLYRHNRVWTGKSFELPNLNNYSSIINGPGRLEGH